MARRQAASPKEPATRNVSRSKHRSWFLVLARVSQEWGPAGNAQNPVSLLRCLPLARCRGEFPTSRRPLASGTAEHRGSPSPPSSGLRSLFSLANASPIEWFDKEGTDNSVIARKAERADEARSQKDAVNCLSCGAQTMPIATRLAHLSFLSSTDAVTSDAMATFSIAEYRPIQLSRVESGMTRQGGLRRTRFRSSKGKNAIGCRTDRADQRAIRSKASTGHRPNASMETPNSAAINKANAPRPRPDRLNLGSFLAQVPASWFSFHGGS